MLNVDLDSSNKIEHLKINANKYGYSEYIYNKVDNYVNYLIPIVNDFILRF